MKKKITTILCLSILIAGSIQSISAQSRQEDGLPPVGTNFCKTHEVMEALYKSNPQAKAEQEAREAFTQQYIEDNPNAGHSTKTTAAAKYRIPVVMHVYGGATHTFWGKTVTKAIVDGAIADLNKDWQALNSDYGQVNNAFASTKSKLDISFELAKKKADGTVTDGIDWKTTTGAGYGGTGMDAQVAADAWDNKMYFNIYIVADLYGDGQSTNSGVCWYPDVSMTNGKTARMVYNGQYLGANTTAEFRSVFTHEAGHFMNLIHTFEGNSCTGAGDNVADTPSHTSTSLGCHPSQTATTPQECGHLVNVENYMDYNGAFDCQRMFSVGQIARVEAALNKNDVTRFPLWQTSNLIATGLLNPNEVTLNNVKISVSNVYPNPACGKFRLDLNVSNQDNYMIEVSNMFGQVVYSEHLGNLATGYHQTQLDITKELSGVYFLSVIGPEAKSVVKLVKE